MSQSVEPLASSPEPTTEPVSTERQEDRDQFFEARGPADTTTTTDGTNSDVEDTDSEASFHSLAEDFQQSCLEESGAEAAFTTPPNRCTNREETVNGRVGAPHHSSGSDEGAGDRGGGVVNAATTLNKENFHDVTHPRLSSEETVLKGNHQEHSVEDQEDGAIDDTRIPDFGGDVFRDERDCSDERGGKNNTTSIDVDEGCNASSCLINEPNCKSESLGEDLVVDDSEMLSPEEFDICCLDAVKAADQEWELEVKDRDTDLVEEELYTYTSSAVFEKREGNVLFAGGLLRDAITRYNEGLKMCPLVAAQDRAMLYHNRAVAYDKMEERKLAVHSLSRALELDPRYCKALARRAGLHEALDSLDDALADYKALLELDPSHRLARAAVQRLPPMIEERNEKLKAEMLGKLKDLGNMFLRPFGLSTSNFQMQQDPNTGGYNINFQQKPDQ